MQNWQGFSGIDLLKGICLTCILFLTATAIPFAGIVAAAFIPLPIVYYGMKGRSRQEVAIYFFSLTIGTLIFLSLKEPTSSLIMFSTLGLIGLVLAETFRRRLSIEKVILYPVILALIVPMLILILASIQVNQTPWHIISSYLDESFQESIKLLGQTGISSEDMTNIRQNASIIKEILTDYFPSLLFIGLGLVAWVNLLLVRYLLVRAGIDCSPYADLSGWKGPDHIIWLFIIALGALLIPIKEAQITATNLLIPLIFNYFLQGLAIMSYFFKKKMVPPPLRAVLYIFTFTIQYVPIAVAAVGLFDLWIDFRKYIRVNDTTPHE
jgi:uncharacterized protein YybS (DUF2232 family)